MLKACCLATSLSSLIGYYAHEVEWGPILLIISESYETLSGATDISTNNTHVWMRNHFNSLNPTSREA